MNFWDSSAIVALLVQQPGSSAAGQALAEDDEMVVWWGTRLECAAALFRLIRGEAISVDDGKRALTGLSALASAWAEVDPSATVRERAQLLVAKHPLKAADALQLAAAILALSPGRQEDGFVCLDRQLSSAARAERLHVVPTRLSHR